MFKNLSKLKLYFLSEKKMNETLIFFWMGVHKIRNWSCIIIQDRNEQQIFFRRVPLGIQYTYFSEFLMSRNTSEAHRLIISWCQWLINMPSFFVILFILTTKMSSSWRHFVISTISGISICFFFYNVQNIIRHIMYRMLHIVSWDIYSNHFYFCFYLWLSIYLDTVKGT